MAVFSWFGDACSCTRKKCDPSCMTYAHYLEERKPMTNADRIRSMNNKALAEVLLDHKCSSCDFDGFCKQKTICRKGILEWLRDEVSE